jgi:enoyl-CoA hydratase/carnithine racemase
MMCDIILASPTAKFGQPEINLGIIPAGGATQRLTHAIGKSRAMEIILTGRHFSAEEAEKWGLISRIVGEGEGVVVNEAVEMGKTIASKGQIAVQVGKECVNAGKCLLNDLSVRLLTPMGLYSVRAIVDGRATTRATAVSWSLCDPRSERGRVSFGWHHLTFTNGGLCY